MLRLLDTVFIGHSVQSAVRMFAVHACDEATFSLRFFLQEILSDAKFCMERTSSQELCCTRVLAV